MRTQRAVPDEVWLQLDARAGRLSPSERKLGLVLTVVAVTALALAALGYVSGIAYPRLNGDMTAAQGDWKTGELDVRVKVSNAGWVDQRVSALTVGSPRTSIIENRPASFVLSPGESRVVRMRIHVSSCRSVTDNDILPVAVVVGHWWGHQSHLLFSDHGNSGYMGVAGLACRQG